MTSRSAASPAVYCPVAPPNAAATAATSGEVISIQYLQVRRPAHTGSVKIDATFPPKPIRGRQLVESWRPGTAGAKIADGAATQLFHTGGVSIDVVVQQV